MTDRRFALSLAILKHSQHRVVSWIIGSQLDEAMQKRYRSPITRLILDLTGTSQSRNVVRGNPQHLLEGFQGMLVITLGSKCHTLQRPELRIPWCLLQGGTAKLYGPVEIVGSQRRSDGFHFNFVSLGFLRCTIAPMKKGAAPGPRRCPVPANRPSSPGRLDFLTTAAEDGTSSPSVSLPGALVAYPGRIPWVREHQC